jgi:YegS/Rv2252/BmrU family lipid kinase
VREVLAIVNSESRKGQAQGEAALAKLSEAGVRLSPGSGLVSPLELSKRLGQLPDRVDAVVIGGGDGSIASALDVLYRTQIPLGVLPCGTANSFARNIGMPLDLSQAAAAIAAMKITTVDLGKVNETLFLNVAGLGLSVRIHHAVDPQMKRRFGILAYAVTALTLLRDARPMRAEIICDGKAHLVKSWQMSVCNGRYYGGWMQVSHEATIDDHLLHVCSAEVKSIWQLLNLLPSFLRGTYDSRSGIRILAGTTVEIRTRRPVLLDADGEVIGRSPARFELLRDALRVIVP